MTTQPAQPTPPTKPTLTQEDFVRAATAIGCDVPTVKAVCQVEAPRGGFNPDGTPVTLFEGHKFFKFTNGKYAESHPTLCFPKWTRKFYGKTWADEQARLVTASALDRTAALMSASWGRFQIMGFNFPTAGHKTLQSFINAMYRSEGAQLDAFVSYVMVSGLDDELRRKDWAEFARRYNGADYWVNKYDEKLAAAYRKLNNA